jgi:hypothetical protein
LDIALRKEIFNRLKMPPEDRKNGACGNIMYKTMGVYVFIVTPLPVANLLTADNNDALKPPSFYTCGRCRKTQEKTFGSGLGVYDKKIFMKWI